MALQIQTCYLCLLNRLERGVLRWGGTAGGGRKWRFKVLGVQRRGGVNADLRFWGSSEWGSECRFKVLGVLGVQRMGGVNADLRCWGYNEWGGGLPV